MNLKKKEILFDGLWDGEAQWRAGMVKVENSQFVIN